VQIAGSGSRTGRHRPFRQGRLRRGSRGARRVVLGVAAGLEEQHSEDRNPESDCDDDSLNHAAHAVRAVAEQVPITVTVTEWVAR
jgi:hypothetical protein